MPKLAYMHVLHRERKGCEHVHGRPHAQSPPPVSGDALLDSIDRSLTFEIVSSIRATAWPYHRSQVRRPPGWPWRLQPTEDRTTRSKSGMGHVDVGYTSIWEGPAGDVAFAHADAGLSFMLFWTMLCS